MECDLLTGNIGACDDKTSKGFTKRFILGNSVEIDTVTYSATPNIIEEVTLKDNKHLYSLEVSSKKPFEEFKITGEDKKFGMLFKNDITLWIKGLTPATSAALNILTGGQFWGILEQKGAVGSETFLAIGIQGGLLASAAEWNAAEGAYSVVLTEDMCDESAFFIYDGVSVATTRAAIEGYLTA